MLKIWGGTVVSSVASQQEEGAHSPGEEVESNDKFFVTVL